MKPINKTVFERNYKDFCLEAKHLMMERVVIRFLDNWTPILRKYNHDNSTNIDLKLSALNDSFNEFRLDICKNGVSKHYNLTDSGIEQFVDENKQWLSNIIAWSELSLDDLYALQDEINRVSMLPPEDTVVLLGNPEIALPQM